MKKYPRIIDYLQRHQKPVYELIDSVAMHGSLTPRRGGGITFLIPDKKLITKINKVLESDEPEKATDIISSLIITDCLNSTQDFKNKQQNIPTLIGKKLVVKSVSAKDVELEGGGKLTVNAKFQPFERSGNARRGNMAVWDLSGEVDYENAPATEFGDGPATIGGSSHLKRGGGSDTHLDNQIRQVIERERQLIGSRQIDDIRSSAMLSAVVNKLEEWKSSDDCKFKCAMELIPGHPIPAFFLIFCNRKIFPAGEIGNIDFTSGENDPSRLQTMIVEHRKDSEKKLNAISEIRENFVTSKFAPREFKKMYDTLQSKNTLEYKNSKIENFYHDDLFQKIKSVPNLKCAIDQFCMQSYTIMHEMSMATRNPAEQLRIFDEYVRDISVYNKFETIRDNLCQFLDMDKYFTDANMISVYKSFLRDFAFAPPSVVTADARYRYTGQGEDDDSSSTGETAIDLEAEFKAEPTELSDHSKQELISYLKSHGGKLPPEFADFLKD
jgi:hypothetical protein